MVVRGTKQVALCTPHNHLSFSFCFHQGLGMLLMSLREYQSLPSYLHQVLSVLCIPLAHLLLTSFLPPSGVSVRAKGAAHPPTQLSVTPDLT